MCKLSPKSVIYLSLLERGGSWRAVLEAALSLFQGYGGSRPTASSREPLFILIFPAPRQLATFLSFFRVVSVSVPCPD